MGVGVDLSLKSVKLILLYPPFNDIYGICRNAPLKIHICMVIYCLMLTVCLKSAVILVKKYSAEMRIKVISTLFQQNLLKKENNQNFLIH